jgi:Mg/Co/Ni transporter MgtE
MMDRVEQSLKSSATAVDGARVGHGAESDPEVLRVRRACDRGEFVTARLRFLRLREPSQAQVLTEIPRSEAVRLAGGLPPYTLARLFEHVPKPLSRAIVQSLPEGKRHGVSVILDYRRRL